VLESSSRYSDTPVRSTLAAASSCLILLSAPGIVRREAFLFLKKSESGDSIWAVTCANTEDAVDQFKKAWLMSQAAGDRSAPPRTPLRNISNACGPSPGRPNNVSVMIHKSVLALRAGAAPGGCAVAMQQVSGKQVLLATSPMQVSRVGAMMRSPMVGRTPEDMKRAAKRMQAHVPVSLSPFRPSGLQQHRPQPVFDNQFIQRLPFVASSLLNAVDAYAAPAPPPPTVPTVVDPAAEQARIKKAEAKAKREAKAALKAEQEALRREQEQRAAKEHAVILAEQNAAVLDAIANVDAEDCCDLELIEPLDTMPWQLVAIGQSLRILVDKKVSLHPMSLQQIQDALRARKPTLETENMLAALHSPLIEAARGKIQSASKMSSTSSWMTQVKKWGTSSPFCHACTQCAHARTRRRCASKTRMVLKSVATCIVCCLHESCASWVPATINGLLGLTNTRLPMCVVSCAHRHI